MGLHKKPRGAGDLPIEVSNSAIESSSTATICVKQAYNPGPPVHRLPLEILSVILRLVCLSGDEEIHCDRNRVIALSGVCSYWRNTMIKDALVWTAIQFDSSSNSHQLGSEWLTRSHKHHVDIAIYGYRSDNITAIFLNLDRIRTIGIRASDPDRRCLYSILELMQNNSNSLRSLINFSVDFKSNGRYTYSKCPPRLLGRLAPPPPALFNRLRTLSLVGTEFDPGPRYYSFKQLHTLKLGKPCTIETLRAIVATACNLNTITLHQLEIEAPESVPTLIFPLSLNKLILSGIGPKSLSHLFDTIHVEFYDITLDLRTESILSPALGGTVESQTDHCVKELIDVLCRVNDISSLILNTSYYLTGEHVSTILSALPNTQTLVLKKLHLDKGRLLAMMRPHGDSGPPFPKFSSLQLEQCRIDDVEAFQEFIGGHPIKKLSLVQSCLLQGEKYEAICSSSTFLENVSRCLLERVPNCQVE